MSDPDTKNALKRARLAFRRWRRSRPFWAGVFTLLAALIILFPPYASLKFGDIVISLHTLAGISALVIGIVLIACAVSFWSRPEFRTVAGIVTLLLSLVAIVTANLGSFLIGTTLGLIGAALGIAWSPKDKPPKKRKRDRRKPRHGSHERESAESARTSDDPSTDRLEQPAGSGHGGNA